MALRRIECVFALVVFLLVVAACEKKQPSETARPTSSAHQSAADARRRSPDLLEILADPGDKGPLNYTTDADGNEWLVNPRNGYRYPVEDGVPVMLLEEGAKHRDPNRASPNPNSPTDGH